MGKIPEKAIGVERLTVKGYAADGSHEISKVKLVVDGKPVKAYYKKVNSKDNYPELLAKISVATSILKRIFQGNNSAEDRLVMDEEGKILGTLSIEITDFKSFSYFNEPLSPHDRQEERIPNTRKLIANNAVECLLGRFFLQDNDVHAHNVGFAEGKTVDIDFDMFFYWFTVYMKTPRGYGLKNPTEIVHDVRDWINFPDITDSAIYHWPTHPPGSTVLQDSSVPAIASTIIEKVLPKPWADINQFIKLAGSPEAHKQKVAAAMKILVTFQPEMVRSRLKEHFGDIPFDYKSLGVELSKKYEEQFPNLCNEESNKQSFVDFIMNIYQLHYDSFYRMVVFFMGCEKNDHNLALQPTCKELYQTPSIFQNILLWAEQQNSTIASKSSQFDLKELNKRYHQIWRDSWAPTLKQVLIDLAQLIHGLKVKCSVNLESISPVAKAGSESAIERKITDSWTYFTDAPELLSSEIKEGISVGENSSLRDGLSLLVEFHNQLHTIIQTYYTKQRDELTPDENSSFCYEINQLLKDLRDLPGKIRQNLACVTDEANRFNAIETTLIRVENEALLKKHLVTTDSQMEQNSVKVPQSRDELIDIFCAQFFTWARGLKQETLLLSIEKGIKEYEQVPVGNRTRGGPVRNYLQLFKQSESDPPNAKPDNDELLAYIFTSGSREDGALNLGLVNKFTRQVVTGCPQLSQSALWTECSQSPDVLVAKVCAYAKKNYARQHIKSFKTFVDDLFKKIAVLPRERFTGLLNTALHEYEAGKSYLTAFWSTPRKDQVTKHLKDYDQWPKGKKNVGVFSSLIIELCKDQNSSFREKLIDTLIGEFYPTIDKKYSMASLFLLEIHSHAETYINECLSNAFELEGTGSKNRK